MLTNDIIVIQPEPHSDRPDVEARGHLRDRWPVVRRRTVLSYPVFQRLLELRGVVKYPTKKYRNLRYRCDAPYFETLSVERGRR